MIGHDRVAVAFQNAALRCVGHEAGVRFHVVDDGVDHGGRRRDLSDGLRFIRGRPVTAIKRDALFVGNEFPLGRRRVRFRGSQVWAQAECR